MKKQLLALSLGLVPMAFPQMSYAEFKGALLTLVCIILTGHPARQRKPVISPIKMILAIWN